MTDKLLNCPFCDGEAEIIGFYIKGVANNYQYFVRCKKCKARPRPHSTFKKREKAIEVWNTRKPMDKIVKLLEMCAVNEPLTENGVTVGTVKVMPLPIAVKIVKGVQNDV